MIDPETISLVQSFAYGFAQNLISSAIVEWKKLKDDAHAENNAVWLANVENAKPLQTRIEQKVNQAFQQLQLTRDDLNVLLPLACDPLLSAEFAQQIISDQYTPETIVQLLQKYHALSEPNDRLQRLSGLLITSIQSVIADDQQLFRIKILRSQAKITEEISDLRKEVSSGNMGIHSALSQLPTGIEAVVKSAMRSVMAECSPEAEHLKSQYQKQFDRARQELIEGSIVIAEKNYRDLVGDLENLGAAADRKLLFRSYTNLASSLWQQFRRDEAIQWFEKAYATKPDEEKAKTNKALCHIHRGEFEDALSVLQGLKNAKPDSFEAYYLISCVHEAQGSMDQAIVTLEERRFESDDYFEALAHAYLKREDYSKATEAARNALAKNKNSIEAHIVLANSLGFPLVRRRMRREIMAFSLTESEHTQMLEAIRFGEIAAKLLKSQERRFQLGEMLTNLSAFYELVDDDEKAVATAKEAAEFTPQGITTLTNLWAAQMRISKYRDAYDTAGKLILLGEKLAGKLRQLESLLLESEHERLLKESESDTELLPNLQREPRFFELKARAQYGFHQIDTAFVTINEALLKFPENARLHGARASLYEDLGQLKLAQEDIENAEKFAGESPRILVQAAMFFYHRNNWSAASERFAKIGADSIHSPFLNNYLICLHNLKQFLKCFALATKAIAANQHFNETLHELAARCAYGANDLPAARRHFEALVQHNTARVVDYQKMLADVYLRLDEPKNTLALLKKAFARKPKDVGVLIGLSISSSLQNQHKDAVTYGFASVQNANDNPRAHMVFVKAVLDCPPQIKIDDKYKNAFQQSLEFLNKHPSGFIKAIPFEKDLKSIIQMTKARADHAHRIEGLIQKMNLPMSVLGQQLGLPPFQTWLGLIGHSKLHIHMANGTADEQVKETELAQSSDTVCIDVFALFTLRLLKCLDLLPKMYPKILVHTAILEGIVENIRELEKGKAGMTISYQEGKLIRSETGPEQITEQLCFLRDIRDFLKGSSVELVGLDAGFISSEDMKQAREFLGVVYYEPILVSKSRTANYYADDAPLRSLASNSHGVKSFCTQAVLRAAKAKRLLSDSQYEDAVITLLRHNYYFVSESVETLARLVELEGFQPSELTKKMLSRVADSKVDQNTAVRIISDFSLYIWRADLSKTKINRNVWLDIFLDPMLRTKQPDELFVQFLANLGVKALTSPMAYGGVVDWILRNGKLSGLQRKQFYIAVQQVILHMASLATQQYAWWPTLAGQWRHMGRINISLQRTGWV